MRFFTVGDLRKAISEIEDSVPVVIPGMDHSYDIVSAGWHGNAEVADGALMEFHGNEYLESETNKVIDVFVIS